MPEDAMPNADAVSPQPVSNEPPKPPEVDDFMKGLRDAANRDIAAQNGEDKEVDDAFKEAEKKDATKQTPVEPDKDKPAEIKLNVNPEPAKDETFDHELTDDVKVPKSKQDWDKWRENRNRIWKEKEELKRQITELKPKVVGSEEVEQLRKERDELAARFKEAVVVNDPALTADIDTRLDSVVKLAKGSLDPAKGEALETIMRMPASQYRDKALAEFFEDVPPYKQSLIAAHIANADQLSYERKGRIDNARANADNIIKQRQQQAEAQKRERVQRIEKVFQDVTNEFKSRDGWKDIMAAPQLASAIETEARNVFSGGVQDEAELGRKAYHAAMAPVVMQLALDQARKLQEMEQTIQKLKGSQPQVNTIGTTNTSRGKDSDPFSAQALINVINSAR